MERRGFLINCVRVPIAVAAGAMSGELAFRSGVVANNAVQDLTGYQADKTDSQLFIEGVIVKPVAEEIGFRGIPSLVLARINNSPNPLKETILGTESWKIDRREFLVGIATTALFGLVHMRRNPDIIPASQTLGGLILWTLQRRFGIAANTIAHIWNNYRAIN